MKGKAKMNEDGYAVIPFMIRADQKTEGTETFKFSFFKDKKFKKEYSSFSLNILDESVETTENNPTLSPKPAHKQPVWSGPTDNGTWFTIAPSRQRYMRTNPHEPESILTANREQIYFRITGKGIDKNNFDLIMLVQLENKNIISGLRSYHNS